MPHEGKLKQIPHCTKFCKKDSDCSREEKCSVKNTCEPKTCIETIVKGSIIPQNSSDLSVDALAEIQCDRGYVIRNNGTTAKNLQVICSLVKLGTDWLDDKSKNAIDKCEEGMACSI